MDTGRFRLILTSCFGWFRYCDENYCFLPQDQVVRLGVETVKRELAVNPKALVVCGTYTIGKERVFIGKCPLTGHLELESWL